MVWRKSLIFSTRVRYLSFPGETLCKDDITEYVVMEAEKKSGGELLSNC